MTLPSRLRALRRSARLTQEELAEFMRYSVNAVRNWELGYSVPKVDAAAELADFFNVSLDYLVGMSDKKRPTE